jgi:hypothetical protein
METTKNGGWIHVFREDKQNGYLKGSDVHVLFPENSKRKINHVNNFIMAFILNYYAWNVQFKNNASKL